MIWAGRYSSIGALLADALVAYKSECALIEVSRKTERHQRRYSEVRARVGRLARYLSDQSIQPGQRVAILMSNQSAWLECAAAVFLRGAVLVPVDYKLPPADQAQLVSHSGAVLLFTEYGLARMLPSIEIPTVVTEPPKSGPGDWTDLNVALEGPEDLTVVERTREDVATVVYSSGTGGTPKGCLLSHGNYLAQLESLLALYPMTPGQTFFSFLPTNHAIDFMCGFLVPFSCGATVLHQRTLRPEFLLWTMQEYSPSHLAAVPRLLEAFETRIRERVEGLGGAKRWAFDGLVRLSRRANRRVNRPRFSRQLLGPIHQAFGGKLELIVTGGAYVPPALAQSFQDLGIPVAIGYGLTEACTVLTVNRLDPWRGDTVGVPVEGTELRIVHADGEGVGEVQARGPTVFIGYLNEPELTAAAFTEDGWLRTGDLGYFDASGHLRLVGRSKNMIVTAGGKNVYPEDVEAVLRDLPCDEFAVFAANYLWPQHSLEGEQLVVVARGLEGTASLRQLNRKLPDFKRIHSVLHWSEDFPRTAALKLKRPLLAEQLRDACSRDALEAL